MFRYHIAAALAATLILSPVAAKADEPLQLTIKDHKFTPESLQVPVGKKFHIIVTNADKTPEEFESSDLDREKLVAPGSSIKVFLGPLDAGTYHFFGDFHEDTAKGILIAK